MLLLVTKSRLKTGFFSRRKAKKGKLPPVLTGIHLGRFPAVTVEFWWEEPQRVLAQLTPYLRRGDVAVVPEWMEKSLHLNACLLEEYARRQCVNFCLQAIAQEEKRRRVQAALVDREGECVGVAAEFLGVCDTLWVATDRPELFDPCAAYTRQQYGNRPLLTSRALPPVDLVIAPYGMGAIAPPKSGILAAREGELYPRTEDLVIAQEAAQVHLPGLSPLTVTAGLFCAFAPPDLMESTPTTLWYQGRPVAPGQLWAPPPGRG